jgi:hypothetical protein
MTTTRIASRQAVLPRFQTKHLWPLTAAFATLSVLSPSAKAEVIVDDTFNYAVGTALGGQGGWVDVNSGDVVSVVSGSLSGNLTRSSSGNSVSFGGAGIDPARTFAADATTLFYSFLIQVTDLGSLNTTGGYLAGFGSGSTVFGTTVWTRSDGAGGYNIGMEKRTGTPTYTATSFTTSDVVYVVGSYTYGAEVGDDVANLWINPDPVTFGLTAPTATITDNVGSDLGVLGIERFFLRQDSTSETPAGVLFDELRVGNTYAEVTAIPEPTTTLSLLGGLGMMMLLRPRRRLA